MSAPVSHHPLVVNTADGSCWTRRAVTRSGGGLYALAGAAAGVPDEVLTSLADLAELGITGSAFALPVPVGVVDPGPVVRPLELHEAQIDALAASGNRVVNDEMHQRLCMCDAWPEGCVSTGNYFMGAWDVSGLETAIPAVLGLWESMRGSELERLRARVSELEAQRQADHRAWQHDLRTARDDREATAARIAELELERHSTNDALADVTLAQRAAESADRLTAFFAPVASLREEPAAEVVTPRVQAMRALLDGQRAAVEDPHDGPLHHSYRVPRDLPEMGGAQ